MMTNNMFYRIVIRIAFVVFWLVLIAAFVYFSPIQNLFFTPKKSISVATWADYIDEGSVKEFESATGIKVYINFYENNEELLSKMELTKSKTYDLVIPTDSSVDLLVKKGMLKK